MILVSIILLLIIIVGIFAIAYVITYNNLVNYEIKIEKAEGIIAENLRQKYDLIAKMNIAIKKVVTKKDYLKDYIDLKDKRISNYELDRKLTEAMNIILEVKNDYIELDTKEFKKDLQEINEINETLISCKTYYNKNTTELNQIIRKFPSNIVAMAKICKMLSSMTLNYSDQSIGCIFLLIKKSLVFEKGLLPKNPE